MKTQVVVLEPWLHPMIEQNGTRYVIDLGLRQFRDTFSPQNHIDFDSVHGQQLCQQASVISCLQCGMSVIVAASLEGDEFRCMKCGTKINVGPFPEDEEKALRGNPFFSQSEPNGLHRLGIEPLLRLARAICACGPSEALRRLGRAGTRLPAPARDLKVG